MIHIFELSTLAIHLTVSTYTAAIELIIMAVQVSHNYQLSYSVHVQGICDRISELILKQYRK